MCRRDSGTAELIFTEGFSIVEPIIKAENLTYIYGAGTPFERRALDGVSFELGRGEYVGLIGHTGSGKSTLIQHLNGLLRPSEGRVLLDGRDIWSDDTKIRDVRFKVGLVFQYPEYQLFEETVEKDIAFGPTNMGLSADEVAERVREAARFVGIDEAELEKSPFELSGGQKRRVAIAGVIAMRPEVLILDEPTAGLDPRGRREILGRIMDYHRESGATILLVTHSMEEAARYADRIIVLDDNGVNCTGTPAEVFAKAEELERIGLDVPMVTKVFGKLKALGVDVDPAVYTVDAGVKQLLSLKGGNNDA